MTKKKIRGFIYIWYDRKYKRYYIGSHWGEPDDGYVCSSDWMRHSYKRRPQDFRRRILAFVYSGRSDLLDEEHRWITKIKPDELGKKYYNLTLKHQNHWAMQDREKRLKIGQKIAAAPNKRELQSIAMTGKRHSPETIEKLRKNNYRLTPEERQKQKQAVSNYNLTQRDYSDPQFIEKISTYSKNRTIEHRAKISESNKRLIQEGKIGMKGKHHSNEGRNNISNALKNSDKMKEHAKKTAIRHWKNRASKALLGHFGLKPPQQNPNAYASLRQKFLLIDPDGNEHHVIGLTKFCQDNNLERTCFSAVMKGTRTHHKGWKCYHLD